MSNKSLKSFVGEYAFNIIKNITIDQEAIRKALVTPQNARNVFENLTEFSIKSLCAEISNDGKIGQIRKTTQEEIITAFNKAGYDRIIFDNKEAIAECEKYYKAGEVICTYNNLTGRMQEYHMIVAIKKNIDKIEREIIPQRDDEYGTSILNIQIAKNGSHMSIKNRYNHTVSQPDSTLNNNLDKLYSGLQSMVLGYYGFASLSNKKTFYPDIVKIGDVYLKYNTEINNVYVGAFTLDSTNGVRFTDTSRYYITKGHTPDGWRKHPLILDFKEKKAITLGYKAGRRNDVRFYSLYDKKYPLISRAIREGIITSDNKENADSINAVFQDAKKELLQANSISLKYIHDAYGYDFTKPYKVTGILGNFTAKNIEKATGSNTGILFVCIGDSLKVCEMNDGKFNVKNIRDTYKYAMDTFYTLKCFEEARKSPHSAIYVIQQEEQYMGTPNPIERRSRYYSQPRIDFDKSGCDITEARRLLKYRLENYKRDKRAKEVAEVDYTNDMIEIKKSFAKLKSGIIKCLTNAETEEDYGVVQSLTNYSLKWLVRDMKSLKQHVEEKSFASISDAQYKINSVKTTIENLKQILKGGK